MAESPAIRPEPFRDVSGQPNGEPASGDVATSLSRIEARVQDVSGRLVHVEAGLGRVESAQKSTNARLDDLAPRLSAVEKPLVKRGAAAAGKYTAIVALAGAVAQFWAARDPSVAEKLKAIGEALSGILGG